MSNSFGKLFKISTYGESHGKAIGVIIDGCPSGIKIDKNEIQNELERRKPGQSKITTQRKENELIEILSGIFKGKTFMLTGKLEGISRAEAKSLIEKNSGKISSNVNKKLDPLRLVCDFLILQLECTSDYY